MEYNNPQSRKKRPDYFEDYIFEKVPRKNGRGTKTVRVYAGDYHRQSLSPAQRHWLRALYMGLFFTSVGLLLLGAARPIYSNTSWFVGAAQVVALGCYAWVLMAFVVYIPTGQNFTKGEYRSGALSLRHASLGTAIALVAVAICTLVYYFANLKRGYTGGEFWAILLYLLAAVAIFAVGAIEKRVPYSIVPSEGKLARRQNPAGETDED